MLLQNYSGNKEINYSQINSVILLYINKISDTDAKVNNEKQVHIYRLFEKFYLNHPKYGDLTTMEKKNANSFEWVCENTAKLISQI